MGPSEGARTLEVAMELVNSLEGVFVSALSKMSAIQSCMIKLNSNEKSINVPNVRKRKASIQENELPANICGKPNAS